MDGRRARSARPRFANEEKEWSPEHLVLTGLCRCVLTSFRYHARRAGHEPVSSGKAHAVVTRREEDGRFAIVEIRLDLEVTLEPAPDADDAARADHEG